MKQLLLVLLSTVAVVLGKASLRVKWGPGAASPDQYISLPVTVNEAKSQSWKQEERVDKVLPSLVLYCHPSFLVCVFYDDTDNAAGLQIAVPQDDVKDAVWDWKVQGYYKWTPSNGKSYWTKQQYYVTQEYLNIKASQRVAQRKPDTVLQVGGVWVSGLNGELFEITNKPEPLLSKQYTEQGCFNGMGLHFWRLNQQSSCGSTFFPWFLLFSKQRDLIGTGLGCAFKLDPAVLSKDFFERPGELALRLIVPRGPQCLYELGRSNNLLSMHVFFIEEPWKFTC
ncbi:hypothetical protein O0L34_g11048 [Tuta absoluta]|nr:hypothetical protein O0L34_g11048 [Tuta absoluta]